MWSILFLIVGVAGQILDPTQMNFPFSVNKFSSSFYAPRNELRVSWVDQGVAHLAVSTSLGQVWQISSFPGNYLEAKVEQEYLALFNGSHLEIYQEEGM